MKALLYFKGGFSVCGCKKAVPVKRFVTGTSAPYEMWCGACGNGFLTKYVDRLFESALNTEDDAVRASLQLSAGTTSRALPNSNIGTPAGNANKKRSGIGTKVEKDTGKYLKAEHLKGLKSRQVTVMSEGEMVDGQFGPQLNVEVKLADGKTKTWSISGQNKNYLIDQYGDDTDAWLGKKLDLEVKNTVSKGVESERIFIKGAVKKK